MSNNPPVLARGDLSQIEARVIAWMANAQWKLDAFRRYDTILGYDAKGKPRRAGPDTYVIAAAGILQKPGEQVTPAERQAYGKVSELSLGFQGGPGALQRMAKNYNSKIPRHPKSSEEPPAVGTDQWIVDRWRKTNPEIVSLWGDFQAAALHCMQAPEGERSYINDHLTGLGMFYKRNSLALTLRLPSDESLWYWTPALEFKETPWGSQQLGLTYWSEDSVTKKWTKFQAYGGLLTQNPVQAIACEVMGEHLVEAEDRGFEPVLTVHDEIVAQRARAEQMAALMCKAPVWAPGLPVVSDSSEGPRYVKA